MTKPSKPVSEIDRLIELASDEKPQLPAIANEEASPIQSLSLEDQKDPRPSMWRILIQLRVLLPYLAKVLPLLERGLLGTNITGRAAPTIDTSNLDREIAGVGEAQRDLDIAVKAQTADIRLLQEKVAMLARSIEKNLLLKEEIAASLTSLRKQTTTSVAVTVGLLLVLIVLVVFTLFRH